MQTVKVRLRKNTRVSTFSCGEIPLRRGDACIVRDDNGLEYGICVTAPEPCEDEGPLPKTAVVRKASPTDESNFIELEKEEARAKEVCAEKIQEHGLPMKLVDVEYTFDKHKVVFYFTADERVDFRKLVRDLAHDLKARIELRHIQVRDEAKLIGSLGVCGRELCCSTWLQEFKPISMKMAKRQNLSLNPSKISGQCGRLLCCLSYENDQYEDPKKVKAAKRAAEEAARKTQGEAGDAEGSGGAGSGAPGKSDRPQRSSSDQRRKPKPQGSRPSGGSQGGSKQAQGTGDSSGEKRTSSRRRRRRRRPSNKGPRQDGGGGNTGGKASS